MPNQITNSHRLLILVPQGAEYQAVVKSFKNHQLDTIKILPTPIGCIAVREYLQTLSNPQEFDSVIVMGLCGSLNPHLKVGNIVIYTECLDLITSKTLECAIQPAIKNEFTVVKSLTSDRLIHLSSEKQNLYQNTNADVVDMEGFTVVEFFSKFNIPVGMIRVVSDDSGHDLPNIEQAIDQNGKLKPLKLAIAFIKQPLAAMRLISGSLKSLKVLSTIFLDTSSRHL